MMRRYLDDLERLDEEDEKAPLLARFNISFIYVNNYIKIHSFPGGWRAQLILGLSLVIV